MKAGISVSSTRVVNGGMWCQNINSTSQNENSLLEKPWYNVGTALKEDLIMAKHYDKQFKLDAVQYWGSIPKFV